jgi:hypothetical protein
MKKNKLEIWCGNCNNNIMDFEIIPGYVLPEISEGLCGGFLCDNCKYKAYTLLVKENIQHDTTTN